MGPIFGPKEMAHWGKPAGESISRAAEAHFGGLDRAPAPAAARDFLEPPSAPEGPGQKRSALWHRLLATVLTGAPAVILAWPLLVGGPVWAGAFITATSLALAAAPWLPAATPRWIRAAPGALLAALGVAATVSAVAYIGGPLAVLCGWGFARLSFKAATDPQHYSPESRPVVGGYVAAAASVIGLALSFGAHYATLPWIVSTVAGFLGVFLLIHLPPAILSLLGGLSAAFFYGAAIISGLARLVLWLVLKPMRWLRLLPAAPGQK